MNKRLEKAKNYIDNLTINSKLNLPKTVVEDPDKFFSWDNEKRSYLNNPCLFDYSYYNGVVMEGLFYVYERTKNQKIYDYVKEYLDTLITADSKPKLIFERAGYVDYHGADCYKTASLFMRMGKYEPRYLNIAATLYRDLTDETHLDSRGNIVSLKYRDETIGFNYWHGWSKLVPPKYKLWLDGLYMLQPFLSGYANLIGDDKELDYIQRRFDWVAKELLAPNGLYYHAANSSTDVCPFFWLRAMGWYGMAMVDVMPMLPESYLPERMKALEIFVEGLLKYQHSNGLWANLVNKEVSNTNRLETSGTAMIVYTILKAIRLNYLPQKYAKYAIDAFNGLVDEKLTDRGLTDIYLKASANGIDNYQNVEYYLTDEGKGVGPFIMAYAEMLYLNDCK